MSPRSRFYVNDPSGADAITGDFNFVTGTATLCLVSAFESFHSEVREALPTMKLPVPTLVALALLPISCGDSVVTASTGSARNAFARLASVLRPEAVHVSGTRRR